MRGVKPSVVATFLHPSPDGVGADEEQQGQEREQQRDPGNRRQRVRDCVDDHANRPAHRNRCQRNPQQRAYPVGRTV